MELQGGTDSETETASEGFGFSHSHRSKNAWTAARSFAHI
jgi:hypothetical protein